MKKMIILTVLGLLVGLAGAVGIVITREKQARAAAALVAADSAALHADSAAAHDDPLRADSAHAPVAHGDSTVADSAHAVHGAAPVDSSLAAIAGVQLVPAGGTGRDSLTETVVAASAPVNADQEKRLARIFAAMRPNEAARVMEQMTDPEVKRLLSHLGERQAAAIMSSISPERAAVISSALIRGDRSAP